MFTHTEDVIYARKFGTALTMDVLTPDTANGIGLIFVISGGWFSSHAAIADYRPAFIDSLVERGFTVFAVVPSSQPKFTIPEILEDMHEAVRYIRHHASDYGIDEERLGIYGCSAGGHLSLMVAYSGGPGNPDAALEVERESSRVQAIAEFFGPTDFLHYGDEGARALGENILADYRAPFDFHEFDEVERRYIRITDPARRLEIGDAISPVSHVSADSPPTLLIHGDLDELVPIQQSKILVQHLEAAGVPHKLITVPGAGHSWEDMSSEVRQIGDWFDEYLRTEKAWLPYPHDVI